MGLQCAKQGHIPEFGTETTLKRFGPEGESFPLNLSKNCHERLLSSGVTTDDVASLLNDISRYSTDSYSSKERILTGEETDQMSKEIQNDKTKDYLRAEGEVDIHQEYIELPKEKITKYSSINECFVQLPSSQDNVEENNKSETEKSESENSVETSQEVRPSAEEKEEENQWSYTLYNFEGNGIATKKDLYDIMTSICNVVGKTVYKDSSEGKNNQSLKVQLEFSRNNSTGKTPLKSPNKYTPSKYYRGMIFPPPNSKEAEKVSVYLEEKLSHFKDESSRTELFREKNNCDRCISSGHTSKHRTSKKDDEKYGHIPKRKNTYIGNDGKPDKKRNEPFRNSRNGENIEQCPQSPLNDRINFRLKCDSQNKGYRLKHSCKSHTKLKEAANIHQCRGKFDQDSAYCQKIKFDAKKHLAYYDNDSLSLSSHGSSQSSGNNSNNSNRSSRQHKNSIVSKSYPEQRRKTFANEPDDFSLIPSRTRPAVWPGECTENKDQSRPYSTTHLCICKRMCGLNYPCNHTSITHTHNHEHHHYYYLPKSEKT